MMQVGIRALKQNASAVVAQAAEGEIITITDRGRPVATLAPLSPSPLRQRLEAGLARPAKAPVWELSPPAAGPSLSDALTQMRDEEH